mmetsp:Transcript_54936/g.94737  ORF Transcript_54936/g.94737 Transcript_54936/m.94737 type:complete len:295 (+) Transcript_54936:180-1064(+)
MRGRGVGQLPCRVEPVWGRPHHGQRGAGGGRHVQGACGHDPGGAFPDGVHADHQRLVRPRSGRGQRAVPPHPLGSHQRRRSDLPGVVLATRGLGAGFRARPVGRPRLARDHAHQHVRHAGRLRVQCPASEAQSHRLAGHLRPWRLVHCAAVVVRPRNVQRWKHHPARDRPHGALFACGFGHRHRQRLQVHRGRRSPGHAIHPRGLRGGQGEVYLRRHHRRDPARRRGLPVLDRRAAVRRHPPGPHPAADVLPTQLSRGPHQERCGVPRKSAAFSRVRYSHHCPRCWTPYLLVRG